MNDTSTVAVIIPFRSRGTDPFREQNLARVLTDWRENGYEPIVVSDGRRGSEAFCRSAAYNQGVELVDADVYVFAESDLLIAPESIELAVDLAVEATGLVIPFSEFRAIGERDSRMVRHLVMDPSDCLTTVVRGYRGSIGAINVVSRKTYDLVGGYDEKFEGAWYDDDAMKIAFEVCGGPTRWIDGPAYHLYHLSSGSGDHLTDAERAVTMSNRRRYRKYQAATTADEIRVLTCPETGQ
jgi:hypothetical protein